MLLDQVGGVTIETFRGDLAELHAMAVASWRDEYGRASFPDLYRPEFVRFATRGAPADHLVAAYDGDRCVSFVALLPRSVVLHGERRRACLAGLLTSRVDYLRRGIAEAMIRGALGLNAAWGYDLALLYLETGHRSTRLVEKLRARGAEIVPLRRLYVLGRVLDMARVDASEGLRPVERRLLGGLRLAAAPPPGDPAGLRPYRAADLPDCLELVERYEREVDLARRFGPVELAAVLDHPGVARTLVVERGGRAAAFINWIQHTHVGREPVPWAWICHVAVDALSAADRRRFYAAFLRAAAADGCAGAVEWAMGYHGMWPALRNRFFPYPRSVTLYAWCLAPDLRPSGIKSMFDMQI